MTFTQQEAQAALGALDATLKQLFSGTAVGPAALTEVSEAVAKMMQSGQYPIVNLWLVSLTQRNPDAYLIFGIFLAAMTHHVRTTMESSTTKQ